VQAPAALTRERHPVPIIQDAGWAPWPICTDAPTGIRCPDRLARRESLYRLHYLGQRYDRVKVIIKQTCAVLDRPLGLEDVEAPTISRQSAHKDGKVVSPSHRPPLSPIRYPWYSFLPETGLTAGP
jgi:hypothetical protein